MGLGLRSDFDGNDRGRREVVGVVWFRRVLVLDFLEVPGMGQGWALTSERREGGGGGRRIGW